MPAGSSVFVCLGRDALRFVTDLLGAAPLGLPVAEGRVIDGDPDEYVWIGDESMFPARTDIMSPNYGGVARGALSG